MPACIGAAKTYATFEEMSNALQEITGCGDGSRDTLIY
jgi:hypothetical protein